MERQHDAFLVLISSIILEEVKDRCEMTELAGCHYRGRPRRPRRRCASGRARPAGAGLRGRRDRGRERARLGPCPRLHALEVQYRHGSRRHCSAPWLERCRRRRICRPARNYMTAICGRSPRRPSWRRPSKPGRRVEAISRLGIDKVASKGRGRPAFPPSHRAGDDGAAATTWPGR